MIYTINGKSPRIHAGAYIAPSADIIGDVEIGAMASVWFGAVLRGDVEKIIIGEKSNVQDGAVFHGDAGLPVVLGEGVTVGHRAVVHGCIVGSHTLIGMGAVILNGAVIGENCIIAAGAVVAENARISAGSVAGGVPAKVFKAISDINKDRIAYGAKHYMEMISLYRSLSPRKE